MKKFARITLLTSLLLPSLMAAACHHKDNQADDSLSALASPETAENYGYPYWNDQFQRKTDLWQKALTFCNQSDHKFSTNCQPVLAVAAPRVPFSTGPEHPLGIPAFGPTAEPPATH